MSNIGWYLKQIRSQFSGAIKDYEESGENSRYHYDPSESIPEQKLSTDKTFAYNRINHRMESIDKGALFADTKHQCYEEDGFY